MLIIHNDNNNIENNIIKSLLKDIYLIKFILLFSKINRNTYIF